MSANDKQVGGEHYKKLDPQPWDIFAAWGLDWFRATIIKYVVRSPDKGGVQDLEKARHVLDKLIEIERAKVVTSENEPTPAPRSPFEHYSSLAEVATEPENTATCARWNSSCLMDDPGCNRGQPCVNFAAKKTPSTAPKTCGECRWYDGLNDFCEAAGSEIDKMTAERPENCVAFEAKPAERTCGECVNYSASGWAGRDGPCRVFNALEHRRPCPKFEAKKP